MITPKMKDDVLEILVNKTVEIIHFNVDAIPIMNDTRITLANLNGILYAFNNDGLVKYQGLSRGHFFDIQVNEKAHQKLQRGGYQLEELIVLQQLDKLNEEVKQLKTKFSLEDLNNLSSIVGNITTTLTAFFK